MTGRSSRSKGQRGERELVKIIRDVLGLECRRGFQSRSGSEEADIEGFLPGYHLESKRAEKWALHEWIAQAEGDAKSGEVPVVVCRRSREKWYAVMAFTDFLELLKT